MDGDKKEILSLTFNQDSSRLAVGGTWGYKILKVGEKECITAYEKLVDPHDRMNSDATSICSIFLNTNLVAHVGAGTDLGSSQRCLRLINTKRGKEITRMNYEQKILNVLLNRLRLVVILKDEIYMYRLDDMQDTAHFETKPNELGVAALATCHVAGSTDPNGLNNYLAYPAAVDKGTVDIYDAYNIKPVTMIEAHDSPVRCLAFNNAGDKLATSSVKGTIIRVFSVPDGEKLFEFRRGMNQATIYSMAFNDNATMLCVSSSTKTVHIFKLDQPIEVQPEEPQGWGASIYNMAASATKMLPATVVDSLLLGHSFASGILPVPEVPNICTLVTKRNQDKEMESMIALVATVDGYLYKFNVNLGDGGECELVGRHALLDSNPADK